MNADNTVTTGKTQAEIIRDHLATKGSITQMEASGLYCITDLAGRIRDIRNKFENYERLVNGRFVWPFDVVSETKFAPNGTRYVRYWSDLEFPRSYTRVANKNGTYLAACA